MIDKDNFIKYLKKYSIFEKGILRLEEAICGKKYGSNIWESDWAEAVGLMFDIFCEIHFTNAGWNLISSYMFEDWRGSIYDEEGKEIADIQSLDDLWDYMIQFKEDCFK